MICRMEKLPSITFRVMFAAAGRKTPAESRALTFKESPFGIDEQETQWEPASVRPPR